MSPSPLKQHIGALDGIRGGLALWVFWGHLANAVGLEFPLLRAPALAVDLFMFMSGFLMSWHWELDQAKRAKLPFRKTAFAFWLRRFFRIAPVYYLLLGFAIWLNPNFDTARSHLQAAYPPAVPTVERLAAPVHSAPPDSVANVIAHLTFTFGLFPSLAANNPLPDWSLSLEMQFYLLFPFIIVLCRPLWIIVLSLVSILVVLSSQQLFGVGNLPAGCWAQFPQPSLLPLKINIFVSGVALGWLAATGQGSPRRASYWIAFLVPLFFVAKPVCGIVLVIGALILSRSRMARIGNLILGSRPFRLAADLSYGVYLLHLLPSYLVLDWLRGHGMLPEESACWRFLVAIAILTVPIYLLALALHHLIERPGISLGKRILRRPGRGAVRDGQELKPLPAHH